MNHNDSTTQTWQSNTLKYRMRFLRSALPGLWFLLGGVLFFGSVLMGQPDRSGKVFASIVCTTIGVIYSLPYLLDILRSRVKGITGALTQVTTVTIPPSGKTFPWWEEIEHRFQIADEDFKIKDSDMKESLVVGEVYTVWYGNSSRLVLEIQSNFDSTG